MIAALTAAFAITHVPGRERIIPKQASSESRFDEAFKKQDRVICNIDLAKASVEPIPVVTERIYKPPEAPAPAPAPPPAQEEPVPQPYPRPPAPQRKRVVMIERMVRNNALCARHNMRKVITNGGRSWRCRR